MSSEHLTASMVELGKARYRNAKKLRTQNQLSSETPAYIRLADQMHEGVANVIQKFFDDCSQVHAPCPVWLPLVWELEADEVALLAIKRSFDLLDGNDMTFAYVSFELAKSIEDEVRVRYFKDYVDKNTWKLLQRDRKNVRSRQQYISKFWDKEKNLHSKGRYERFTLWTKTNKAKIGAWLLETIRMQTNLFTLKSTLTRRGSTIKKIAPNPQLQEWVRQFDENSESLRPFWLATTEEPLRWESNYGGGYMSDDLPVLPIMKKAFDLRNRDLSKLYEPLNRLQEVPYRINKKVHDIMLWAWEGDVSIGAMEKRDLLPVLEPVENLKQTDPEAFIAWKREAKYVHDWNLETSGRRMRSLRIMYVAKLYSKMEKFYFPVQVDYRGRVYSVPSFVSPQSCDLGRSCLEFYRGVAIKCEEDAKWLKIHGANVWGRKGTFEDRIAWVEQNTKEIVTIAEDPRTYKLWQDASEPWAFLAFCFEYAGYKEKGYGFVTHLPCRMDASCNGIQILSLLLKDEEIGKLTNLVPDLPPQDVYQHIADRVNDSLHKQKSKNSLAGDWLKWGIDRRYTKRIVMTKPFGMNGYTSTFELESVFLKEVKNGRSNPFGKSEYLEALLYLSTIVNKQTNIVLENHINFMKWIKAKVLTCPDTLKWETPFGIEIQQHIYETVQIGLFSVLGMEKTTLNYRKNTDKVDPKRQAKAVVANYIHSIDASVVHFLACKSDYDITTIHDCFATHSTHAPKMHKDLREIYHEIFNQDLTGKFKSELLNQSGNTEVTDSFELGTLDVSALNDCTYMFS
jgi:DNA-directed RNA polymerase